MPPFSESFGGDNITADEWRKEGGHPCPNYYDHRKRIDEEERERWGKTLDKLLEKPKVEPIYKEPKKKSFWDSLKRFFRGD